MNQMKFMLHKSKQLIPSLTLIPLPENGALHSCTVIFASSTFNPLSCSRTAACCAPSRSHLLQSIKPFRLIFHHSSYCLTRESVEPSQHIQPSA
mmetsp:Transcript_29224/g.93900  ORF Transcript_29224/g.93900 Transcript_29224/m.93900 type:complete len:94 (-) Transcript_29224:28-309(-)